MTCNGPHDSHLIGQKQGNPKFDLCKCSHLISLTMTNSELILEGNLYMNIIFQNGPMKYWILFLYGGNHKLIVLTKL